jgi:hypothetical protein
MIPLPPLNIASSSSAESSLSKGGNTFSFGPPSNKPETIKKAVIAGSLMLLAALLYKAVK